MPSFPSLTLLLSILTATTQAAYYLSLQDWSSNLILNYGWTYENEQGHAFRNPTDRDGLIPFYQLRSPNPADYHSLLYFYTNNENEKAQIIADPNWVVEETWYVHGAPVDGGQDLHRLFNAASGDHIWTIDPVEVQQLQGGGWSYDGVAAHLPPPPPSPWSLTPPPPGPAPDPISRYRLVARPPVVCCFSAPKSFKANTNP